MMSPFVLLIIFIIARDVQNQFKLLAVAKFTSLEGRHLVVAFTKTNPTDVHIIRNATGCIVEVLGVGPLMLSWLSIDFNFTWSILQTNEDLIVGLGNEGIETTSGQLRHYLENEMCDLVIGTVAQFYIRLDWMDFLHGYADGSVVMIIPNPQPIKYNVRAIVKPFQFWVWIGLFLTLTFTLFSLYAMKRCLMKYRPDSDTNRLSHRQIFYYVIRLILNQGGGFLGSRRFAFRLVAGCSCILAFVLVTAYQSVLISFIMAPGMQPPIISSISDLAKKNDVHLVVDKGMAVDVFFTSFDKSVAMQNNNSSPTNISNIYYTLGKKVKENAESRCITEQRCIDLVKQGKSVYVKPNHGALSVIEKDFHDSGGHCNLAISTDKWTNTIVGWAVPKNSPYTKELNRGILRMNEAGLTNKWRKRYEKDSNRCTQGNKAEKDRKSKKKDQRITLQNMSGSFVVLLVGIFCSFVVFIIELILGRRETATVINLSSAVLIDTASNQNDIIKNPAAPSSDDVDQSNTDAGEMATEDKESSVYTVNSSINNQTKSEIAINLPNSIEIKETASDATITFNVLMGNDDTDKGVNLPGNIITQD